MTRYDLYSTFFHAFVLGFFLFWVTRTPAPAAYYGFQFLGGQSGFGTGRLEPAPAPAPATPTPGSPHNPKEAVPQPSEDTTRVAVEKKTGGKKKGSTAERALEKKTIKKGGTKGGRGIAALGHGDFQGSKTGPVGGVGTSLEIGGFGPGGAGGVGQPFPFKWYGELVYRRLWESWDRTDAGTMECKVAFKIKKNGEVAGVKIKTTSGDALFDMNAKRAVLSASFPPLPEGFKENELPIVVRFRLQ